MKQQQDSKEMTKPTMGMHAYFTYSVIGWRGTGTGSAGISLNSAVVFFLRILTIWESLMVAFIFFKLFGTCIHCHCHLLSSLTSAAATIEKEVLFQKQSDALSSSSAKKDLETSRIMNHLQCCFSKMLLALKTVLVKLRRTNHYSIVLLFKNSSLHNSL